MSLRPIETQSLLTASSDTSAMKSASVDVRVFDATGKPYSSLSQDSIAHESPVAMVYNGISHAVMMASPIDLEDFALGFSLTEGIIETPQELYDLEIEQSSQGLSVSMQISSERFAYLKAQRRNMTGRTGCGLCGTESLEQAVRPVRASDLGVVVEDAAIQRAVAALRDFQPLQAATGATHVAAWCTLEGEVVAGREDVGRHNALDKLIGCQVKINNNFRQGFALISSRASFEMVQKSAAVGIGCLVAVSAPTALAIEQAQAAGIMLVGFARQNRHVIYHPGQRPNTG